MSSGRLQTFADGVIAIAATLLILNCRHADRRRRTALGGSAPAHLAVVHRIRRQLPDDRHHLGEPPTLVDQIGQVDRRFLRLNVMLRLCVAFIPFPTRLVAENIRSDGAQAAALTYGITLTSTAVMFSAVWFYAAIGRRLIREDADSRRKDPL